jgi:hypothetical protein
MKYNFFSSLLTLPMVAAAVVMTGATAYANCSPAGSQLMKSLNGAWRGGGSVTPIGGSSEPINCRISYASGMNSIEQKLTCAGTDYRITATSNVTCSGGSVSGRWLEQIANNTGSVTGGIGSNYLNLEVDGPNFKGRFAVNFESESRHKVTITQFDPAAGRHVPVATINLTRG